MYTSYFGLMNRHPELASKVVAISRGVGKWYEGRRYLDLAPSWGLVNLRDHEVYEREYRRQVLDRLDPAKVIQDLGEDAILLCWEKPGEFCHRRIVAAWLEENLGIEVPEWGSAPTAEKVRPPPEPGATQMSLF